MLPAFGGGVFKRKLQMYGRIARWGNSGHAQHTILVWERRHPDGVEN